MRIRNIFILLTILSITVGIADAATITVDDSGGADYTKIQDAINVVNTGDIIEVRSGTYYENVNVNKQIILRGMDTGEGKPVVDANGIDSAITLNSGGNELEGFITRNSGSCCGPNYPAGIRVNNYNNIIKNNIVSDNNQGIVLFWVNGNMLSGNTIRSNAKGIYLYNSNGNILIDNDVSYNRPISVGIELENSDSNTLESNAVTNNEDGIFLINSDNNILTDNTFSNNILGIDLCCQITGLSSKNNMLIRNTVSNNNFVGIDIEFGSNNLIYNNFFNNVNNINFKMIDSNIWNVTKISGINIIGGPYLGGNFWSKPDGTGFSQTCADIDNDEICDSSYILNSQNIDYLPLATNNVCGNTPSGQNVEINPSSNIDMTYGNVIECGNTSVMTYSENQWSSLPNNYQGISFNDIQTTATYSNDIIVNIAYSDQDISGIDENSIKMFHYENGDWIDVISSLDTANNKVTGTVNSLSPFAIAGSSSGTPTPTVSPTTTPISGGSTVRGSSLNIIGVMVLAILLIIVSILRIRKN